ncbi:MAG TPA: VWA domain-containing protein [Deltaproteobacteria bacterium]|nr:VWA domain-containing protein [Deltaproteobacteria bacterium]HCP45271.1 VWA domain-containing protein [Deltaproteobacteria bacterium]
MATNRFSLVLLALTTTSLLGACSADSALMSSDDDDSYAEDVAGSSWDGDDDDDDGDVASDTADGEDESGSISDDGNPGTGAGQLTAGEWRDLDNWDFWSAVLQRNDWAAMESAWDFSTVNRFAVSVEDDGEPVADAVVVLQDAQGSITWEARTDVHGEAELFANLFDTSSIGPYTVTASDGLVSASVADLDPIWEDRVDLELAGTAPNAVLDLMFVIDTTGSMGDELSYLQAELADVLSTVQDGAGQSLELRLSVNFYRDEGDQYVLRSFPFTTDLETSLSQLSAQDASGGGDWPEAVEQALDNAVYEHQWSDSAVSRLMFLVLDAPPHNTAQNRDSIHAAVTDAAAQGIRIIPVAASGIDKSTEFLLRFMDISTGGTYTFLTDDSGIGNSHIEPTVGSYQVEFLNDLLTRLVLESIGQQP